MSDEWKNQRKIATLPIPVAHNPENVLARTLEKVARIKAIAIVIEWENGVIACDYSAQDTADLMLKSAILHSTALKTLVPGQVPQ